MSNVGSMGRSRRWESTATAEMVEALNRVWLEEPQRILGQMSETERLMLAAFAYARWDEVSPSQLKARHGLLSQQYRQQ